MNAAASFTISIAPSWPKGASLAELAGQVTTGWGEELRWLRRLVRHPAYLGDLTCGLGAALLTRDLAALALPAIHGLFLMRVAIPELEWRRRVRRPGRPARASRSWELIPFLY